MCFSENLHEILSPANLLKVSLHLKQVATLPLKCKCQNTSKIITLSNYLHHLFQVKGTLKQFKSVLYLVQLVSSHSVFKLSTCCQRASC